MARPRRSITAFGPAMMGGLRSSGRPLRTLAKSKPALNPRLSVNEDPSYAPPNAGAEEAAATGNEPAASSVPVFGAPERDNKWPDGTRVMPERDAKRAR